VVAAGGGGGGGGYFGGGGGTCQVYLTSYPDGAGGGGSGYAEVGNVSHAITIAGRNGTAAGLDRGTPPAAAAMRSPFYRPDVGWGGGRTGAGSGGNGQVVIEWGARSAPGRSRPAPRRRPEPRRRPPPASGSPRAGQPGQRRLPWTGFPFVQVGIVAVALIGLGAAVMWAGGRRPQG
jgi:hypothetical protein